MSPALASIEQSWPDKELLVRVTGFDPLLVPVANLERSIDFYAGLFGLRVAERDSSSADSGVLLHGAGRVWLALRDLKRDEPRRPAPVVVVATVESVAAAREVIWDLGIPAMRDIDAAGDDAGYLARTSGSSQRSFVIHDPDGHQVEFVERSPMHAGRSG